MSTYALVQRGVAHADSSVGGGVSPLDITVTAIKLGTAFISAGRPKERRKEAAVQAGTISITNSDAGPTKDSGALTAFDVASSYVLSTLSQKRTDAYSGASVKIKDSTHVTATFHQPAAGDTIDIDFQVVEKKSYKGATLRILNATTLRLEWDGTLTAGESIDVAYDLFDLAAFGDDIKEILFRQQRALSVGGENSLQDLQAYDLAGNPTVFRIRTFDTKAHRLLATLDLPGSNPLETGELSRVTVTLTWPVGKNRPSSITSDLTDLAATPGIG